ncbi:MobF family relaxase [Geobacter sulfurreducens]|uniref:MobF family relaxase n=1 Tax=Geobacter sulfurreducens TaxID=35554 RepID=UPI000DBB10A9|nr:MobF family relaxase [Geobacter sulfurreducens]BBA70626.1 Multifunctional conjugation protein TraI [Geobacter sulfurreducens]
MISESHVSGSQALRYYYQRDSLFNTCSAWFGRTAEKFGLSAGSTVNKEEFAALLAGLDPRSGAQLIPDGPGHEHRAGVDFAIHVPKGYSILALTAQDDRLIDLFDSALEKTLHYAEDHFAQVRMSVNGEKMRIDSDNFAVTTFKHSTSRELDPLLHAHNLFLNISERLSDHKFVAIENYELYRNRHLLDQYFKNELAIGVQELGYSIVKNEKGDFEIAGVAPEVIQTFSKRREQVLDKAEELRESGAVNGLHDAEIRERANLESRESKRYVEKSELRERWDKELAALGTSREKLLADAREAGKQVSHDRGLELTAADYIRTAAQALTETESTFTKSDLLKTAGKLALGEYRVNDLDTSLASLVDGKELLQLSGRDGGHSGIYTTREMFRIEKELVSIIRNSVGRFEPLMSAHEATTAIDGYISRQREQHPDFVITEGQRDLVLRVISADSHVVINGRAGVGKSKSFEILNQAISAYSGREVELVGMSFTGKASSELQQSSGITSGTLASFLAESGNKENEQHQDSAEQTRRERVYIVDEASMMGSRDAYKLFKKATRENAKVILVGDVRQLLAVNAGRLFADVQQKNVIDVTTMNEVLRQRTEHMKEIVGDLAEKRIEAAFDKLTNHGKLYENRDKDELMAAITNEFASKDDWHRTLVLSSTNASRNELNQRVRQELQSQGKISQDDYSLAVKIPKSIPAAEKYFAHSYQVGDRVFASMAGGGLRAGTEAEVVGLDHDRHFLTLDDGKGNVRLYDLKKDGQRLSAYAVEEKEFSVNEKIMFTKNDRKIGVQNGLTGTIERIDAEGNLAVRTEHGDQVSFNTKNYAYLDHGAVVSVHKSQGMTANNIIFHVDSGDRQMNTMNSLYTAISRGKFGDGKIVFTDDIASIREQMTHEAVKSSTLDYDRKLAELDRQEAKELGAGIEKNERNELISEKDVKGNDRDHGPSDMNGERESSRPEAPTVAREMDTGRSKDLELER